MCKVCFRQNMCFYLVILFSCNSIAIYLQEQGLCNSPDTTKLPKSCNVRCFADIDRYMNIKSDDLNQTAELESVKPAPFVVSIRRRHHPKCTGVIISTRYVLSSAVCLKSPGQQAAFIWTSGSSFKNATKEFKAKHLIPVQKLIIHPDYTEKLFLRDIGLIKLARDAVFNSEFYPACINLAPKIEFRTSTLSSHVRKQDNVIVSDYDTCNDYFDSRRIVDAEQFCGPIKENCLFTAGSPLLEKIPKREKFMSVLGLLSIRKDCKFEEGQLVFTRVSQYANWIADVIYNED